MEVKKNSVVIATFTYDGDGRQVKAVVGSVTTYYVGAHYQVENGVATKYYFAGAQRVAMRKGSTLSYLLGDHLGSTSITTNTSGALVSEMRYKPWGETRYTSGTTPTQYQYTGQRNDSYINLLGGELIPAGFLFPLTAIDFGLKSNSITIELD